MASPIKPLGDRVVAIQESAQTKTASGLYLPDGAQEKSIVAKVVAVGPDSSLAVNDRILYKEYTATQIKLDRINYLIVREEDILATL